MAELVKPQAKSVKELLEQYQSKPRSVWDPERIRFDGVGKDDVYNITAPFLDAGEWVIAGRVEARDSESSKIVFFTKRDEVWHPRPNMPELTLQDPFYARIHGEIVIGGVETFPHPEREGHLGWRTVMYKGAQLSELRLFFKGPDGMKDLRIVQLADGSIGVFTRPQGSKGGRGKIGFVRIPSLNDLSVRLIEEAPLIETQFLDAEWGGANELHLLANGLVGVLGHIACFDDNGGRHYYPMVFAFDPEKEAATDIELIAQRADFLPGEAKRGDLVDVVFSGGLVRGRDGTAELYAGISDAEAQRLTLTDPFLKYEK